MSVVLGRVYLTKREAAARAGVSIRTIERAIHDGQLRSTGGGRYDVRVLPEWVDAWLEQRGRGD